MKWLILTVMISTYVSAFGFKYSPEQCSQLTNQINTQQQSIDYDHSKNCGGITINQDSKAICQNIPSRQQKLQEMRNTYNKKCQ